MCVVAVLHEVCTYVHVYNLPFPFQLVESEMGSTTTTLVNSVNSDIHGENLVDGEDGFNLGDSGTGQQVRDTPTSQSHAPELLLYQSWRLCTLCNRCTASANDALCTLWATACRAH